MFKNKLLKALRPSAARETKGKWWAGQAQKCPNGPGREREREKEKSGKGKLGGGGGERETRVKISSGGRKKKDAASAGGHSKFLLSLLVVQGVPG